MIDSIILNDLPIYGMAYQGKYIFRLRKAIDREKELHGSLEGLTLDVIILTIPHQARVVIATPMARTNTLDMGDAALINKDTWDRVALKIHDKLITTN